MIGAGIAGIGAARQLKNSGCDVRVIEASDRCGGRIKDDHSLGRFRLIDFEINNFCAPAC